MSLATEIDKDLLVAMKAQESLKVSVLRMIKAAFKNRQIELGKPLEDSESIAILRSLVKQRHESVEQFRKGGREDLASKEEAEIKIVESYLPAAVTDQEIETVVAAVISETGATGSRDFGKVMKAAMAKFAGRNVKGKRVSELARQKLGG